MGLPAFKFDTLALVKSLREVGVDERQAEVYAENQAHVIQMLQEEQLVTKDDIHRLEIEIVKTQQGIKDVERDIKVLDDKTQQNIKLLDERIQHQGKEFESALKLVVVDLKHEMRDLGKALTIKLTLILGSFIGLLMTFFEFMHKFNIF